MKWIDLIRLATRACVRAPARAAVLVLTSLGEGARRYIHDEFAALGTNLVMVFPGRNETVGASPAMFSGGTPRDLTIADSTALLRSAAVRRVAPIVIGQAKASVGSRERDVQVLGATDSLIAIRHWRMAQGRFLPAGDPERGKNVAVLGPKVRRELFGARPALGEWIRLGDRRFRVIGILATSGRSIGLDVQELVILPVAAAQTVLNAPSLFRIMIEARSRGAIDRAREDAVRTLRERHQGEDDVTVVTQDAVLATFDRVLRALTLTVAGIGAISLAVAGILIMNVMLVSVSQRTEEIGLLKALGSPRRAIVALFLAEALLLSSAGAALGLGLGQAVSLALARLHPALAMGTPWWAILAAGATALSTGLAFGVLPARRAAALDPVAALAGR